MAKIDTVNKFIDSYLAGKSESAIERFKSKSIDKQYQSIMTWRYNMRKRDGEMEKVVNESKVVISELREMKRRIDQVKDLDEQTLDEIVKELKSLLGHLDETRQRIRTEEIARLENQQLEIQIRLEALRNNINSSKQSDSNAHGENQSYENNHSY